MKNQGMPNAYKTNRIAKLIYGIFVAAFVGLMFVSDGKFLGVKFYGALNGNSFFAAFKMLFIDLFKKTNNFALNYMVFATKKWLFFSLAALIVINLILFIGSLFIKNGAKTKKFVNFSLLFNFILTMAFVIYYNITLGSLIIAPYTAPMFIIAVLSTLLLFALSFTGKRCLYKSIVYLLSLLTFAALFIGNTQALYGNSVIYLSMVKQLPQMLKTLAQMGYGVFVYITVLGLLLAVVLAAFNLIISAARLCCNKVCIFDIIRFTLIFVVSALFYSVMVFKLKASFKQYGTIAIVVFSLILTVLSFVYYFRKNNSDCGCSVKFQDKDQAPSNLPPVSQSIFADEVQFDKPPAAPIPQSVPETINIVKNSQVDSELQKTPSADFSTQPAQEEPKPAPAPSVPQAVQLEFEKLPEGARAKLQEEPKPAPQIDIESLKKEILADLYMKERTSTMAEDTQAKPVYEIKNNQQSFSKIMPSAPQVKKVVPLANPYLVKSKQSPPDRFFDSLSEQEQKEFDELFISKIHGENKRLPSYVIGQPNTEFFARVFIFIGRYREIISESLLSKIYLYSVSLSQN